MMESHDDYSGIVVFFVVPCETSRLGNGDEEMECVTIDIGLRSRGLDQGMMSRGLLLLRPGVGRPAKEDFGGGSSSS